jgi:hypothetical protein
LDASLNTEGREVVNCYFRGCDTITNFFERKEPESKMGIMEGSIEPDPSVSAKKAGSPKGLLLEASG